LQSSEAKNLLNQSLDQYRLAEQSFQSKDYPGTIQHAQKALDLIHQAQSTENQYQQQQKQQEEQQLLTRIVEVVVVVAVLGGCAAAAVSYVRRRKRSATG
jgi:HEPN domain-containing protein